MTDYIRKETIEKIMAESYIGSQVIGRKVGTFTKKTMTFIVTGTLVIIMGMTFWVMGFVKGFAKKA
jgi:hypothetical protein